MPTMPLFYTDFNDLYVIAIGLSMAYIAIRHGDGKGFSFLQFLSNMAEIFIQYSIKKKTKPQQKDEATNARINYYLGTDLLSEKDKGALELISKKATETLNNIKAIEQNTREGMNRHTKTEFLNVCAFDCSFYGIFLLFFGQLASKGFLNIDWWVLCMNCTLILTFSHCILYECLTVKHFRPNILLHTVSFIIVSIVCLCISNDTLSENRLILRQINVIVTPIICFGDFIVYFAISFAGCFWQTLSSRYALHCLKLEKVVKEHEDDFNRYTDQIKDIDTALELLGDNTPNAISLEAEQSQTL